MNTGDQKYIDEFERWYKSIGCIMKIEILKQLCAHVLSETKIQKNLKIDTIITVLLHS